MKKEKVEQILHDEQGVKVVSEQINAAYNEGVIEKNSKRRNEKLDE